MSMGKERILIMGNGDTHVIIGETNIYWLCSNCRFRKANKHILEVQELVKPEEAVEQPKKRKPPSKKKTVETESESESAESSETEE